MTKLTDSQLVILSAAAQRDDRTVLPLPASLALNKGAAATVIQSLIAKGLIEERPAGPDDEAWRKSDEGTRIMLAITDAGCEAIGITTEETSGAPPAPLMVVTARIPAKRSQKVSKSGSASAAQSGTKQALLISLLTRKTGVTIGEIVKVTGWQPHSVRGAISGTLKKKLGLDVITEKIEGRGRVYHIIGQD